MFYENFKNYESRAIVVLTPVESKSLIAKAVAVMPEVVNAKKSGIVVVICGSTNGYVADEIFDLTTNKDRFVVGWIKGGKLGANAEEKRDKPQVLRDGKRSDESFMDALKDFGKSDVYIKGANGVDSEGRAGVLMGSDVGGTIGAALGIINARGSNLIVPVGLEKLIPSVEDASLKMGQKTFDYSTGDVVGYMPLTNAKVVTELTAINLLFGGGGVRATHVASGGVGGSEGSVVLSLEGTKTGIKKAFDFIVELKKSLEK